MDKELELIASDSVEKIHNGLGPGLLESVYEVLLAMELERRGHRIVGKPQ